MYRILEGVKYFREKNLDENEEIEREEVDWNLFLILTQAYVYWLYRERNINVREKHRLVSSLTHPEWGSKPQVGVCPDWN